MVNLDSDVNLRKSPPPTAFDFAFQALMTRFKLSLGVFSCKCPVRSYWQIASYITDQGSAKTYSSAIWRWRDTAASSTICPKVLKKYRKFCGYSFTFLFTYFLVLYSYCMDYFAKQLVDTPSFGSFCNSKKKETNYLNNFHCFQLHALSVSIRMYKHINKMIPWVFRRENDNKPIPAGNTEDEGLKFRINQNISDYFVTSLATTGVKV